MSIHIVFLKPFEHYAAESVHIVARALGKRLQEQGVAVPFTVYQKMAKKEADEKAKAKARARADAEKKAKAEKLLKEKEAATIKKAVSIKARTRSKAVKK
jgi:hypothetical protein